MENKAITPQKFWRLFFAIELDQAHQIMIGHLMRRLCKLKYIPQFKWSLPKKLHITLHFLGQVPVEKVDSCIKLVTHSIANIQAFDLPLGTLGLFPPHHPHALALLIPLSQSLANLYHAVSLGIAGAGFKPEQRPFLPHITLGRMTHPFIIHNDHHHLTQFQTPPLRSQPVKYIVLLRTDSGPEGSIYTVIERLPLQLTPPLPFGERASRVRG